MKTILAAIDFSEVSKQVLAEAVALARASNARVEILHVVQPPIITDSDIGSAMSAEYAAMASESAAKRLARIKKQLVAQGLAVQTNHQVGFPGQRIVERAERIPADYIVLGSHGHGAFYDMIVGSTTSRVLKHAKCPVMVVPAATGKARKAKTKHV